MTTNWVTKPIADYADVSDLAGGGYTTGHNATFFNFCTSTGNYLLSTAITDDITFDSPSDSFVLTVASTTGAITGVMCRVTMSGGYWYGYISAIGTGTLSVVITATGDTGQMDASAVMAALDTGVSIAVGGALTGPVKAFQLCGGSTHEALIQSGTYLITASLDAKVAYEKRIRGVKSDGTSPGIWSDDRPIIKPGADLTAMVDAWQAATTTLTASGIIFDGNRAGTYNATYGLYIASSGSYEYKDNLFNVDLINCVDYGVGHTGPSYTTKLFVRFINNGIGGVAGFASNRGPGIFLSCEFIDNVTYGIKEASSVSIINTLILGSVYGVYGDGSSFYLDSSNCLFKNTTDLYSEKTGSAYTIKKSALCGSGNIMTNNANVMQMYHSYCNATITNPPAIDIARITTAPVFVDAANGDYRLSGSNPDYYDTATGMIKCGATGPQITSGGSGGISASRLQGGM